MKILALSDEIVPAVYSMQVKDLHGDVDLVIGCGDLPYYYLEFVTTVLPAPTVYVHGNHDKPAFTADGRTLSEPGGCESLEGRVLTINNILLAGLGGSRRYKPNAPHQYSESEMIGRFLKLAPQLVLNKITHGRFIDIMVTHSPPYGIHDLADRPHTGFKVFLTLMRYFKPAYLLHGHKHQLRRDVKEETQYFETLVVNVYPRVIVEFDQP